MQCLSVPVIATPVNDVTGVVISAFIWNACPGLCVPLDMAIVILENSF